MEIEGIREKALLTDEEIDRVLRDSPFAISHELITEILPDIKRVAQHQVDNVLKTDGIRIECSNQDLPEIIEGKPQLGTVVETLYLKQEVKLKKQAQKDMLKAGFVRCLKKEEK